MSEVTQKSEKITKPIQLLAAWLAGLLSINTCFLVAAAKFGTGSWEASALIVAAISNVPLFLIAVFLLQTKFRPEMQEDSFYSTYLSHKTNQLINVSKDDVRTVQVLKQLRSIEDKISLPEISADASVTASTDFVQTVSSNAVPIDLSDLRIGVNQFLKDAKVIGEKLTMYGVVAYKGFSGGVAPENRLVVISNNLSFGKRNEVIRAARQLGFAQYSLFDNVFEEIEEHVLFGGYGEPEFEIAGANG
jgi:hypothetical protein